MDEKRITINDIAEELGLSAATVSDAKTDGIKIR